MNAFQEHSLDHIPFAARPTWDLDAPWLGSGLHDFQRLGEERSSDNRVLLTYFEGT
jgi:hypothetical protein